MVNYSVITIQDCLENMQYKHKAVVLSNGIVIGFREEEEKDEITATKHIYSLPQTVVNCQAKMKR